MSKDKRAQFRKFAENATQVWGGWNSNAPFYVDVRKPSPSLSKHDEERPTYWRYEDGVFVAAASPKNILELLDEIDKYKIALEKIKNHPNCMCGCESLAEEGLKND